MRSLPAVLTWATLTFYENLLIGQETSVRCPHCLRKQTYFRSSHPQRPRESQSGQEKRRDERFQPRAEEPLGTDSHQTISNGQANPDSWFGRKNALYYWAKSANSISWVLSVCAYITVISDFKILELRLKNNLRSFSLHGDYYYPLIACSRRSDLPTTERRAQLSESLEQTDPLVLETEKNKKNKKTNKQKQTLSKVLESTRGHEESLELYSILWSDWPTSKQRVLRHGNRLPAEVRRRYFSGGEKRRSEIRLCP